MVTVRAARNFKWITATFDNVKQAARWAAANEMEGAMFVVRIGDLDEQQTRAAVRAGEAFVRSQDTFWSKTERAEWHRDWCIWCQQVSK